MGKATKRIRWAILTFTLVLVTAAVAFPEEPGSSAPLESVPVTPTPELQKPDLSFGTGDGKSYLIPALEIPPFLLLLNLYDRAVYGDAVYGTTWSSGWRHVTQEHWKYDTGPFNVVQLGHPYQGSVFFGFARSAGLSFWESVPYVFGGSYLWKMWGETGDPATNAQITTTIGGSFLGEALFRMASLLLEGGGQKPGYWRELGAAGISPPTGLNRWAFRTRFNAVFQSNEPALFWRLRLGGSLSTTNTNNGVSNTVNQPEATGDYALAYGLPGKPAYSYMRPFDYFNLEATETINAKTNSENVMVRGLLLGTKYSAGDDYRGVWGLYGSYDYISPETFRVSSSALSLGTTAQWWLARSVALQGSALGGVGFGAAGTSKGVGNDIVGIRDYHFGTTPQGLLALRFIFGEVAMLDFTGREYYVSGVGSDDPNGSENITRENVGITVRVYGRNAIGIEYVESTRDGHYSNAKGRYQTTGTLSFVYTFLSDTHFGAVEWRDSYRD